ncbi:FtsK/SpoIIIE domain-containing protein [Cyanobacterium aponinum]|uniref:Cell division FtsK/SpoIIIE n=1 Tax=Cyanobacterium aponinum (strain PCC 10605) TaxID=755178 RepID=K9Z9R9_CYAAP|nr:FtsK/SpoIIIE domain-containing protein [Cyanobacterium aponinum]AFZ55467.1 cell division FtsK/SpoIIIE [Cyanobacterium aponinum PCC 10605]
MKTSELIGKVTNQFLKNFLREEEQSDGIARFLLDRLTSEQVAEICREILADPYSSTQVEIKIPETLVADFSLPPEIMTNERTVHLRHATCEKPVLLLANTNDDQGQSLQDITRIGAIELKAESNIWTDVISRDLPISETHLKHLEKALKGLQKAINLSLEQFAKYIADTHYRISQESEPLINALGWALPALKIPRDSNYFEAIPEKNRGQAKYWENLFKQGISKRGCFLLKQTSTSKSIEKNDLQNAFEKVKDQIPISAHQIIEEFINSPSEWDEKSFALAQWEWEKDNIDSLFNGLKKQKTDLASLTIQFFEDEYPDVLTEADEDYLKALKKRSQTKNPNESDVEFYENYRQELEKNRQLKSKWDKFVYGQPVECTDFLVGLIQAFERLFCQSEIKSKQEKLIITTQYGKTKSKWLGINTEVGLYFCTKYRGIEQLTTPNIIWETGWLFNYDQLIEETKQKGKYKENQSIAKTAIEIKFYVELESNISAGKPKIQLIWKANPNAIGMELRNDLERLGDDNKSAFILSEIRQELVNKKGRLQGISLYDMGTIMAAFGQDRGSLIPKYHTKYDLAKNFIKELKKAIKENRLSSDSGDKIKQAWELFSQTYKQALKQLITQEGFASPLLLEQAYKYQQLLEILLKYAKGDQNRINLYQPLLRLGSITVTGKNPAVIVAPWHPLRLGAIAVKFRQVSGLLKYILDNEQVQFGDSRLFFADIIKELNHPYYPEVAIGYKGSQPVLLNLTDTANDYSLLEQPIWETKNQTTNEDPLEAATKLVKLVQRYVELLPHEKTNLTLILYQCDSIKLPLAVINQLAKLQEDQEEYRCHVILRHQESKKLNRLYEQMIENTDADPDAFIASEVSQDFMAKLRISVTSDSIPVQSQKEGKYADIVFLQDVISRQAEIVWESSPDEQITDELLYHVPPRWSRKRPAAKDELKSTVYLVSPNQPEVGKIYLNMIYSIIKAKDLGSNEYFLPARQISFQNNTTQTIFADIHRLGEWVVNYDDLLDRRQLLNQGVQVIRYQQHRTDERNFLVSSQASLNLLQVLVKRRLESLNLELSEEELKSLSQRLIDDANGISGDIVLRAAKCGIFASELIGVVLSKALIRSQLPQNEPIGWYFLDDYANWLGQKEGSIADILVISPQIINGQPILKLIISEAKYVKANGVSEARKTSQKQLRETVERISSALFINPSRLDRDLWLSRLGDLLLEGIEFSPNAEISLEKWRDSIRFGRVQIDLLGYSHVFASSSSDNDSHEQIIIPKVNNCFQEVFNHDDVRQLILAYQRGESFLNIREKLGDEKPWFVSSPQFPAPRIIWVNHFSQEFHKDNFSNSINNTDYQIETKDENSLSENNSYSSELQKNTYSKNNNSFSHQIDDNLIKENNNITLTKTSNNNEIKEIYPNQIDKQINKQVIDLASSNSNWRKPNLNNWLNQNQKSQTLNNEEQEWLNQVVNSLRQALLSYDLQAKVLEQRLTPNAALIQFQGSDRLNISDIERRRSQLLTTHGLNVINVSAQPSKIVVEIARPQRQIISLQEVWQKRKINYKYPQVNLSLIIGVKEIDGEILYLNLASEFENLQHHAPHTLIAGTTGSGKSVLLRNLLVDVCATNSPKFLHIYLIDAKQGTDYFPLENLPHLQQGLIVEQNHAIEVFEEIVSEMEKRYVLFRQEKVNNLFAYNQKVIKEKQLPVLLVVHDEFADWMLVDEYKDAVSSAVQRLGVKARAAGIHLIFAAQRPDNQVFPMQLRDNLGNRLILRVESQGTSEFSLGQKGAENLLGKGHLVGRLSGEMDLIYAQVPFLSEDDFAIVCETIAKDCEV